MTSSVGDLLASLPEDASTPTSHSTPSAPTRGAGRSGSYTAQDITILEGLEAVRHRPGMYIGGTGNNGLHHLLWEIIDNAVDEAINGFATTVEVTLHEGSESVTITDNGRGIPVDLHPEVGKPALEVILTTLHSGAKFNDESYRTSGGLHGVGSSVVNALSTRFIAEVRRDGTLHRQEFSRGVPAGPLEKMGEARGTGTSITFSPDPTIFDTVKFEAERIRRVLEIKAFLNKGLRVVFRDATSGNYHEFKHKGGLLDFLSHITEQERLTPVHSEPFHLEVEIEDVRLELAVQWTEAPREKLRSFANGIETEDGGTHEQGLKDGLLRAVRNYVETHDLVPRNVNITSEDIREGVLAILSILMPDPQFQGQTKDRLNNPDIRGLVSGALRHELEQYLHKHPSTGQAVAARIVQAARARAASRSAAVAVRRKGSVSRRLNLPGKLADCSSTDPSISELFIVEGDSAGGSAKQGRDRKTQAILPLRGKVLNAEQATTTKVMANKELQNIVSALGCGLGDAYSENKLRYHKIVLLMDADSDGHHIATLLLTFFYRYLRPLIDMGYVYIAQPPLYRVDHGRDTWWALDDRELERIISRVRRAKPTAKIDIQRFKGLGEMMPKTLFTTTLDPTKRRLLRVEIPDDARALTEKLISDLLGRDAAPRYEFIMNSAATVDELDV